MRFSQIHKTNTLQQKNQPFKEAESSLLKADNHL